MKLLAFSAAVFLSASLPSAWAGGINLRKFIDRATGGLDVPKFVEKAAGQPFVTKNVIPDQVLKEDKANTEDAAKVIAKTEREKGKDDPTAQEVGATMAMSAYIDLAEKRAKTEPQAITPISAERIVSYSNTMFQPKVRVSPEESKVLLNGEPYDIKVGVFFDPGDDHSYEFKAIYGEQEDKKPYVPKRDRAKTIEFNFQPPLPVPPKK